MKKSISKSQLKGIHRGTTLKRQKRYRNAFFGWWKPDISDRKRYALFVHNRKTRTTIQLCTWSNSDNSGFLLCKPFMSPLFAMSHCRNRYLTMVPTSPLYTACYSTNKDFFQYRSITERKVTEWARQPKCRERQVLSSQGREKAMMTHLAPGCDYAVLFYSQLRPKRELLNLSQTKPPLCSSS